jgi:ankyrin repeat protein
LDVVELLIEHGAWVDAITKSKTTPLHFAAYTGNIEIAELLIEKGPLKVIIKLLYISLLTIKPGNSHTIN